MFGLSDRTQYRILEMIPGTLVWTTFILAIALSFLRPLWVVYFIILFDLYWLLRVCYFVFYMAFAWRSYQSDSRRDWFADLQHDCPRWREVYHLIFLPTYCEDLTVIEATVRRLTEVVYDPKRFIVILAGEERDRENFMSHAAIITNRYAGAFHKIIVTIHPANLPDEIPGKGSNLNWAGRR